jgi:hypothetical protein
MSSRKVVVRLSGGLGNQLFQIAAGLLAAEKSGIHVVYLDAQFLSNYEVARNLESDFIFKLIKNIKLGIAEKTLISFASHLRIARILDKRIGNCAYIGSTKTLCNLDGSQLKNILLDGYFQDPLVALSLQSQGDIFEKLTELYKSFKDLLPKVYIEYVAVHIRRGDYVSSKKASKFFKKIPLDYYRSAVKKFPLNTKFIIFGDDAETISAFSEEVSGLNAASLRLNLSEEFMLLAMADHYVIANSTFSWWAAFLGYDKSKRVIAPRNWYVNNERSLNNPLLMEYFEILD